MVFPRAMLLWSLALAVFPAKPGFAQFDFALHSRPVAPAPSGTAIARALNTIPPARIEETINTLFGFGARSTLSNIVTELPPNQGSNAAASRIAAQLDEISRQCDGCRLGHARPGDLPCGSKAGVRVF